MRRDICSVGVAFLYKLLSEITDYENLELTDEQYTKLEKRCDDCENADDTESQINKCLYEMGFSYDGTTNKFFDTSTKEEDNDDESKFTKEERENIIAELSLTDEEINDIEESYFSMKIVFDKYKDDDLRIRDSSEEMFDYLYDDLEGKNLVLDILGGTSMFDLYRYGCEDDWSIKRCLIQCNDRCMMLSSGRVIFLFE